MEVTDRLEKVEIIRSRTGLGYAEAAELLDQAEGDVLEALIIYERRTKQPKQSRAQWDVFEAKGNEILDKIKDLVRKGNVTKIVIKKDGRTVAEIPVTAGVVGAVLAPQLALLGSAACLLGRCSIEIERHGESNTEIKLDEEGRPVD